MKALLVATILALGISTAAHAAAPDGELIKGRMQHRGTITEQPFTFKNHEDFNIDRLSIRCGVFDGGELIDVTWLVFHDIPAHGEAYASTASTEPSVTRIECPVTGSK